LILYPTSKNSQVSAQDLHDNILGSVATGLTVDGKLRTGKAGLFQSSRGKLTSPTGESVWIAVYSCKSGETIGGGVLVASSEAVLETHQKSVDEMIAGMRFAGDEAPAPGTAAAATGQTIHGLVIPLPAGWTRKDDPGGLIALSPPPPRSALEPRWDYVMYVLPSQPLQGSLWKTHKAVFQDALKASQLKDPVPPIHDPDGPGPFIRSSSAGHNAAGIVRSISMYSALSDGKIECILVHNQEDRDGIGAILSRTTARTPPRKADRPRIVEAYRRGDFGGPFLESSLKYERIWLRSDGVADFSTYYPEGYAAASVVLKQSGLENGRVGSWKARGQSQIEIVRTEGVPAEVYERDDGKLRLGGSLWQPMPAVDGMRLEGRWTVKTPPGEAQPPKTWIGFKKDGRFEDDGILDYVSLPDLKRGKPPKKGAGAYELRDWTIFLKYDDGTSWSTDFSTIGSDIKDDSAILFGAFVIQKE
jgi:hypothetical protein